MEYVTMKRIKKRMNRGFYRNKVTLQKFKKGLKILPHLFTFGNAFFGFYSVILAARGDIVGAAYAILLGALMDALDGRVARLVGATSEIGVQLDSLSDVISFCFAPAFLYYMWHFNQFGFVGVASSLIFLLAGIARLARFNVIHQQQTIYFIGLPSTMAGCFLATIVLNFHDTAWYGWEAIILQIVMVCVAGLMVSSLRFPTFKQRLFNIKKNWHFIIVAILFMIFAVFRIDVVLLLFFLFYLGYSFATMWRK